MKVGPHFPETFLEAPYQGHANGPTELYSQILGLPSLTYFDDQATSPRGEFAATPVLAPYIVLRPEVNLGERNSGNAPGAKESAAWDFSRPDRVPEEALNRVIWESVKGAGTWNSVLRRLVHAEVP